jgi:hypothetical protein
MVVIIGPPAVGKATVGRELAERYGFKLFHNHVSLDAVNTVFEWGHPAMSRLVGELRKRVIEEAAAADIDLVFTYVWAFGEPGEGEAIENYRDIVTHRGGSFYLVELFAPLEERQRRNGMPSRRAMKARSDESSTAEWIADMDARYTFDSGGEPPIAGVPYLRLDVTTLPPGEAAEAIAAAFGFAPLPAG